MTEKSFKQKIYGPYLDAWKAIKILQEAYQKPELYLQYMEELKAYSKKYEGNHFAEHLLKDFALHADHIIAKMEREEA